MLLRLTRLVCLSTHAGLLCRAFLCGDPTRQFCQAIIQLPHECYLMKGPKKAPKQAQEPGHRLLVLRTPESCQDKSRKAARAGFSLEDGETNFNVLGRTASPLGLCPRERLSKKYTWDQEKMTAVCLAPGTEDNEARRATWRGADNLYQAESTSLCQILLWNTRWTTGTLSLYLQDPQAV